LIGVPEQYETITLEPIVPRLIISDESESESNKRALPVLLEAQYV